MELQVFTLTGTGIEDALTAFVRSHCADGYESSYQGGCLWAYEDYTLLNNNYIMVCIRLDSTNADKGIIRIEAIAGGGAHGILNITDWGSEERRLNRFRNKLIDFCEERNIDIEDAE